MERYKFQIHSFVLMNNHFHMLVTTPNSNISEGMRYFQTEVSRRLRKSSSKINHIFGGRYKATVVGSEIYYLRCFKYVFRNPIRAGLCLDVSSYQYSSLLQNRISKLIVPVTTGHDVLLPADKAKLLKWLNEPTPKELEECVRNGLRKNQFEMKAVQKTKVRFSNDCDRPR